MNDRVPCRVSLDELAHNGSDVTDADEQEAIDSIRDDFLLLGDIYPPKGGREVVTAGMVAMHYMDEDDIENALSALVYGSGDFLDSRQRYVETLVRDNADAYLRSKHPNLIERRMEELREDDE